MTDEAKTGATAHKIRTVYLGPCPLKGGKTGSMFIPEATLAANPGEPHEVLRRVASAYDYRPSGVIGGVYESTGLIEGDSIPRLGKERSFRGVFKHDAIGAFEAEALALEHKQRAEKAEKRAAKEQTVLAPHIEALAEAMAGVDVRSRFAVAQGLTSAVVKRAGEIALERRRSGRK